MHRFGLRSPLVLLAVTLASCTTSPLGRQQLLLVDDRQLAEAGTVMFQQLKTETPASRDQRVNAYVNCVADAILAALPPQDANLAWEVVVFDDPAVNAFAIPGAKIGVYTGLLGVAENQDQLATVIGHEVVHVLAHHANERVSREQLTMAGVSLAAAAAGGSSPSRQQSLYGLMGLGAQVGLLLPFNRAQEREADLAGLDVMARAGFDPRQSVDLWYNMRRAAGSGSGQPPEFLSTHPSTTERIRELEKRIPARMGDYEAALQAGHRPRCEAAR
ncbi:MAG: M48 family metallopeptidase [Candidatus Binatia bacterium]